MYRITVDGYTLFDTRDESLILGQPKVNLEENTVGGASFSIYKNHPNYDQLSMLRSIFEISDEFGVIFRGRMTENTRDIRKGKAVDLEGLMAFFNDSIVRPYKFPDDFVEDADYISASGSGNVVEFYLGWLIKQHNEQVEEFQRFKLGKVTVSDPNNNIERSATEYPSTWEEIKTKLFGSTLGGKLCIRYEADGNYIDYLSEYIDINEQGITYGENLRDISQKQDGREVYSAIVPRGAEVTVTEEGDDKYEGMYGDIVGGSTSTKRVTIEELPDGDITGHPDIEKRGDMLISKSALAAYGLRCVPSTESVWDDVTMPSNLQDRGISVLEGTVTSVPNTIETKAVDLHCTDSQIRSFRMYKKIPVYVPSHGINSNFDITALDIDILNPQNTNIAAGKTVLSLIELQARQASEVKDRLASTLPLVTSVIEKNINGIMLSVSTDYATKKSLDDYAKTTEVKGSLALEIVEEEVNGVKRKYSQLVSDVDYVKFTADNFEIFSDEFKIQDGVITSTNKDSFADGTPYSATVINKGVITNQSNDQQGNLLLGSICYMKSGILDFWRYNENGYGAEATMGWWTEQEVTGSSGQLLVPFLVTSRNLCLGSDDTFTTNGQLKGEWLAKPYYYDEGDIKPNDEKMPVASRIVTIDDLRVLFPELNI